MIYIIVIAVGIAIGVYCSKKIDENYANGVYEQIYNDDQENIELAENHENNDKDTGEGSGEESMEQEIERLKKENEMLKQSQKGD